MNQEVINKQLRNACVIGDLDQVKQAIQEGADVNTQSKISRLSLFTPMSHACNEKKGDFYEIVEYLLENGATLSKANYAQVRQAIDDHDFALLTLFMKYYPEVAVAIIDVDRDTQYSLFEYAIDEENEQIISTFLNSPSIDVDAPLSASYDNALPQTVLESYGMLELAARCRSLSKQKTINIDADYSIGIAIEQTY